MGQIAGLIARVLEKPDDAAEIKAVCGEVEALCRASRSTRHAGATSTSALPVLRRRLESRDRLAAQSRRHEIRRRRECQECGKRFTTRERVEDVLPRVVKRDERREDFDRRKLLASLEKACAKRPVSVEALERLATASRSGSRKAAIRNSRATASASGCWTSWCRSTRSPRRASLRCSATSRMPTTTRRSSLRRERGASSMRTTRPPCASPTRPGVRRLESGNGDAGGPRAGEARVGPHLSEPGGGGVVLRGDRVLGRGFTRPPGGRTPRSSRSRAPPAAMAGARCAARRSPSRSSRAATSAARRPAPTRSSPRESRASGSAIATRTRTREAVCARCAAAASPSKSACSRTPVGQHAASCRASCAGAPS